MKRLIASLLFVLAIASPVFAQESTEVAPTVEVSTPAPTEEVTPEPTATPTEQPPVELPDDAVVTNGAQLLLMLVLAAFGGGGLVAISSRFFESKQARDVGEKLYESMPPEQQEWLKQRIVEAEATTRQFIEYLKAISDKQPN